MSISYKSLIDLDTVDIYLCDPQENRMACMLATDRVFTACFNDLSLFELNIYYDSTSEAYYNLLETMRLIEVTGVGYFQITSVSENENDDGKFKHISAESLQTVFKRFGVDVQNRVYCLYNSTYPLESLTNHSNDDSFIPSIVAELHQQIGVGVDIHINDVTPTVKYSVWTITYISDSLKYAPGGSGMCRTMDENVEFAYDLLVNKVEEAFGCVVIFDFMYKTIKFYAIENVAQRGNAYLSFDNFTTDMQVEENADDIVTVLRCEGDGVDISLVNPTGTGYITDFSYYKNPNGKWMSSALITKLNQWEAAVESSRSNYESLVASYRSYQDDINTYQAELTTRTKIIQDMQTARDTYAKAAASNPSTAPAGSVAIGEHVNIDGRSIDPDSYYNTHDFSTSSTVVAYISAPTWNTSTGQFAFSTGTLHITTDPQSAYNSGYYYFTDSVEPISYCKLTAKYDTSTSSYVVNGFDRYVSYKYLGKFTTLQEKQAASLKNSIGVSQTVASMVFASMVSITTALNISNYFSGTPDLYSELKRYWIEGSYNDTSIAVHETTTMAEQIDLANELLENGKIELSKVCQPRFRLSLSGVNVFANSELNVIAQNINLGEVITVEKDETTKYYPVLLKIVFDFDNPERLELDLGNSLRLDDWGYTWADLVTNSAQTARNVSANWQELIAFANERNAMYNLIENPLNSALRAANANMTNQNFSIDTTGILGRVITGTGSNTNIDNEQIRILNNMILFTRDNWETAAAAFGKITIGNEEVYGLVAEALIGRLLIGEQLKIQNSDNTISLNSSGISIKNSSDQTVFSAETNGNVTVSTGGGKVFINQNGIQITDRSNPSETVFSAGINGNLYVKGEIDATSGTLGDLRVVGKLYLGANGTSNFIWGTTDNNKDLLHLPGLTVSQTNATFSGTLSAPSGNIGGWSLSQNKLEASWGTGVGSYRVGVQAVTTVNNSDAFYVRYITAVDPQTLMPLSYNTMFSVTSNGKMTANEALVRGTITADGGLSVQNTLTAKDGLAEFYNNVNIYGELDSNDAKIYGELWTPKIIGKGKVGGNSVTAYIALTAEDGTDDPSYDPSSGTISITYTYTPDANWSESNGAYLTFYIISMRNMKYISDKITLYIDSNATGTTTGIYQYSGIIYLGLSKTDIDPNNLHPSYSKTLSWSGISSTYGSGGSTALIIGSGASVVPEMGSVANLGLSLNRWHTLYCDTQPDVSSSRDLKENVEFLADKYDTLFDNLKPRSFILKSESDRRKHFGFVVDEVVEATQISGVDKTECSLYHLEDDDDPYHNGSLMYCELIALNTWEIQKLKARIKELEKYIN